MSKKIPFIIILAMSFYSCLEVAKEVKGWMETENISDVIGNFHYLENDGIKVYLPEAFKKYSSVEYEIILDSLTTKENFEFESKRLKILREMEGDFYIFFDSISNSTYTINTMPYMPLYRRDAQMILGMIGQNNDQLSRNSGFEINKISAKYNETNGTQIFKAIHQVSQVGNLNMAVNTTYIISSNHKTVFINLTTPYQVNFDPYLQKMIF